MMESHIRRQDGSRLSCFRHPTLSVMWHPKKLHFHGLILHHTEVIFVYKYELIDCVYKQITTNSETKIKMKIGVATFIVLFLISSLMMTVTAKLSQCSADCHKKYHTNSRHEREEKVASCQRLCQVAYGR